MSFWKTGLFVLAGVGIAGAFGYSIVADTQWYLGSLVTAYFVVQLGLAYINYRKTVQITGYQRDTPWMTQPLLSTQPEVLEWFKKNQEEVKTAIMVVGYREDPDYWRSCLESIREYGGSDATGGAVRGVYACVDGDSENDHFMTSIFHEVFSGGVGEEDDDLEEVDLHPKIKTKTVVREFPHTGKRGTMRAGMEWIRSETEKNEKYDYDYDYIVVMDSDSILTPNAMWSLIRFAADDPKNGCATGALHIFNRVNWITRIIQARYRYAFQVERSAMSAMGCMNCCSGPFSIYRNQNLDEKLLEEFTSQTCCSAPVGPGDDRHLTNLVMMRGHYSRQSPVSIVLTECPLTFSRFLVQQLRWMRSYYREQYYQIQAIPHQSWWLMVVTLYELLFPYLVVLGFFPILRTISLSMLLERIYLCLGVVLFRTAVLFTISGGEWDMLYNVFMLPLYFCFLLPMKLYAGLTVGMQGWMTSDRLVVRGKWSADVIGMYTAIACMNAFYVILGLHVANVVG